MCIVHFTCKYKRAHLWTRMSMCLCDKDNYNSRMLYFAQALPNSTEATAATSSTAIAAVTSSMWCLGSLCVTHWPVSEKSIVAIGQTHAHVHQRKCMRAASCEGSRQIHCLECCQCTRSQLGGDRCKDAVSLDDDIHSGLASLASFHRVQRSPSQ